VKQRRFSDRPYKSTRIPEASAAAHNSQLITGRRSRTPSVLIRVHPWKNLSIAGLASRMAHSLPCIIRPPLYPLNSCNSCNSWGNPFYSWSRLCSEHAYPRSQRSRSQLTTHNWTTKSDSIRVNPCASVEKSFYSWSRFSYDALPAMHNPPPLYIL
jgi:hypothetical protein